MIAKALLRNITYLPHEALCLTRAYAIAPFDESIDLAILLNVDPRRGDQLVRGNCIMPGGLDKSVSVAVFTSEINREEALEAGADMAGDEVFEQVKEKKISFQKALATIEVTESLKQYGRILGPKGLMPSTMFNSIVRVNDLPKAIADLKKGSIQFRVGKNSNINCSLGKVSFADERIFANMKAFMKTIVSLKPSTIKGKYIKAVHLTSTQGPSWELDIPSIDPSHEKFLL